jgi:hypothetical protein
MSLPSIARTSLLYRGAVDEAANIISDIVVKMT